MLIKNQKIEITWNNNNREWFEKLGYTGYKWGKKLFVDVSDLSHGTNVRVNIICDYCGKQYDACYSAYYKSHEKFPKDCCLACRTKKKIEVTKIERCEKFWGKLEDFCKTKGYKLITQKENYINVKMEIKYLCPKHGLKTGIMDNMLHGHGCRDCAHEQMTYIMQQDVDYVERYINSINNNKLLNKNDYINVFKHNLTIRCNCGEIYTTSFANFKKHGVQQCRACSYRNSKGESYICKILDDLKIEYIQEKRFDDCRDIKPLPFDFYLPKYNLVIEYDGEGHYIESFYKPYSEDPKQALINRQRKDSIKDDYCNTNKLHLLRIPYWELDNIECLIRNKIEIIKKDLKQVS